MERAELKFIKDAFSQIIDDIAGNPDWHDAASAVSADLGALERELEGKVVSLDKSLEEAANMMYPPGINDNLRNAFKAGAEWQKSQMLKDAVAGTVHHALNCHYIMTDQEALNARLRGIPEGTVVDIFICEAEEDQK